MMQYVVLDELFLDGNLLDEFPFDSNLFVKDVKVMYLQISLEVTEKGIPVSTKAMINIICHNVHTGLMKETRVWMQWIRYFYESNPRIHLG